MDLLLDIIAILIATFSCVIPVRRILKGKGNVMHFCVVLFYVMQVFPLILKCFFGIDHSLIRYPNMLTAMNDAQTGRYYSLFVIFCMLAMTLLAGTIPHKSHALPDFRARFTKSDKFQFVKALLYIGMLAPVFAAVLAPNPGVYLRYAYFYTTPAVNITAEVAAYHAGAITIANRIAWFCTILLYLFKDRKSRAWDIYLSIFVITWISGKRTLLILALLAILVIDFINKRYEKKMGKFVAKTLVFALIGIGYFFLYSEITGKGATLSAYHNYSIYFSRMSNVDVSIYDKLHTNTMLDYPGQSFLYDLFFWVPRSIWPNKPVIYSKYLTKYVMGYTTLNINWQLQVNIWSEFISNLGALGVVVAVLLLYIGARVTEKTDSIIVYLLGLMFLMLYCMFGFEAIVQYIGVAWVASLILARKKKKPRL